MAGSVSDHGFCISLPLLFHSACGCVSLQAKSAEAPIQAHSVFAGASPIGLMLEQAHDSFSPTYWPTLSNQALFHQYFFEPSRRNVSPVHHSSSANLNNFNILFIFFLPDEARAPMSIDA
jgi:hypothetical protein